MHVGIEGYGILLAIGGVCLLSACGNAATKPVDILPEDMCLQCRMAISEKRCAAEFIDREGKSFKFDDLACMGNYIKEKQRKSEIAGYFVADFERTGWIRAEDAYYVHSSRISTPMRGGLIAFRDGATAQAAAAKYQGEVRSFSEVIP